MSVLAWLTLAVAAIIVLALVYYLVNIILALRRAGDHLEKLVGGLEAIRDHTQPLPGHISTINTALLNLLTNLKAVDANLVSIARVLSR